MSQDKAKDAYARWKVADHAARLKEEELKGAWNLFFDQKKVPPSDELIREASRLRKHASELLSEVVRLTGPAGTAFGPGTRSA